MKVDVVTAASVNGIIAPGRGRNSHDLIGVLGTPLAVLAAKRELRRRYGAVLVGSGTVLANDPTMTSHATPDHAAVRATLDPSGRIPPGFRFLDGSARTLIGVVETTPRSYLDLLAERGVEGVPCGEERSDLGRFLDGLAERGIGSVICEGGGTLNRSLLERGLIDRLHVILLPAVLDAGSVNLFEGPGEPARLRLESCEEIAPDYLMVRYEVLTRTVADLLREIGPMDDESADEISRAIREAREETRRLEVEEPPEI
jgi:riboflavin-specific deaminase-like protein